MSKKAKVKIHVPDEETLKNGGDAGATEEEKAVEIEVETDGPSDEGEAPGDSEAAGEENTENEDPFQAKLDELNDKVMRQMAEFENYRKRTEKEKEKMFESGAASVLTKILPVIDNFERGFSMVEADDADDAFVDGMNKVYKQLMTELEKIGVKPIEALGKEFDPDYHNAVMQTGDGDVESGFVAQELQKGYLYNETVLRHSMVAVKE